MRDRKIKGFRKIEERIKYYETKKTTVIFHIYGVVCVYGCSAFCVRHPR